MASTSVMQRAVVAGAFVIAFLVMASIFTPDRSGARSTPPGPSAAAKQRPRAGATQPPLVRSAPQREPLSTDPHEGLSSLGRLEDANYLVQIYATPQGARYSLYDALTGRELGVLLTPEQVQTWFPELPLEKLEFSAPNGPSGLMMVIEPQ